jgi:hypothetical protein
MCHMKERQNSIWTIFKVRLVWAVISAALLVLVYLGHLPRWWFYAVIVGSMGIAFYLQAVQRK